MWYRRNPLHKKPECPAIPLVSQNLPNQLLDLIITPKIIKYVGESRLRPTEFDSRVVYYYIHVRVKDLVFINCRSPLHQSPVYADGILAKPRNGRNTAVR